MTWAEASSNIVRDTILGAVILGLILAVFTSFFDRNEK